MVTPDRRRRAVVVLQERFGVSERRACRVVGQHRSTQRRPARTEPEPDLKLGAGCVVLPVPIPVWDGGKPTTWYAARAGR